MPLVDGVAAAITAGRPYATIARWGQTGILTRHGKQGGRWMYDLDEVCRVAKERSHVAPRTRAPRRACPVQATSGEHCGQPLGELIPVCDRHAYEIAARLSVRVSSSKGA